MSRRAIKPFAVEFRRSRSSKVAAAPIEDYDIPPDDLPVRDIYEDVSYDDAMRAADRLFAPKAPTPVAPPQGRVLPNLTQRKLDPVADRVAEKKALANKRREETRRVNAALAAQPELELPAPEPVPVTTEQEWEEAAPLPVEEPAKGKAEKRLRRGKKDFAPGERWKRRLKFLRR